MQIELYYLTLFLQGFRFSRLRADWSFEDLLLGLRLSRECDVVDQWQVEAGFLVFTVHYYFSFVRRRAKR